jgi:hypothetical protein
LAVTLTVNNKEFQYPQVGEEPGWGEDATAWAEEVTEVLESLAGPDDILQTTVTINNNQGSVTNVAGLLFNTANVRSAFVDYNIYRTDASPSVLVEGGTLLVCYNDTSWTISQMTNGDAGVYFTMTNTGQIQYTSTNMTGGSYTGQMTFEARAIL